MDDEDRTTDDGSTTMKRAITRRDALKASAMLGIGAAGVHVITDSQARRAFTIQCCSCCCCIKLGFNSATGAAELQWLPDSAPIQEAFQVVTTSTVNPAKLLTRKAGELTIGDLTLLSGARPKGGGASSGGCKVVQQHMTKLKLTTKDMWSIAAAFHAYSNERDSGGSV